MDGDLVATVLLSGTAVAIIEGVREYLAWRRSRKAEKEDKTDEKKEELEKKVDALVESQKYIMYDRIRYLGQAYINESEIDFDDRRILNGMHKSYHNGLGGNGDLDILMKEVNRLPLKTSK